MQLAAAAIGLLCWQFLLAPEPFDEESLPQNVRAFIASLEEHQAAAIVSVTADYQKERAKKTSDQASRRAKGMRLKALKDRLQGLRAYRILELPELPNQPQVGDIGRIESTTVIRISGQDELHVLHKYQTGIIGDGLAVKTSIRTETIEFVVRRVPTDGLADGSNVDLPKPMAVTGTVDDGGATRLVLEPFDMKCIEPVVKQLGSRKRRP